MRLGDHLALVEAVGAGPVVGLFVLDPAVLGPAGAPRTAFLIRCLRALGTAVRGRLVVRHGDPVEVVPAVAAEAGVRQVYASWDGGPYGSTCAAGCPSWRRRPAPPSTKPWKQPGGVPAGYPERIVDHAAERAEALSRYESLKSWN